MSRTIPKQSDPAGSANTGPGKRLQVVAGILRDSENRVLISDRRRSASMQDLWEFPGGKLHAGETARAALDRELFEELGVRVLRTQALLSLDHDYPDLAVHLDFFIVSEWRGEPAGREGQALRWVHAESLEKEKLLPADAPVIEALAPLSKC